MSSDAMASNRETEIYDVVGFGFGPANLALMVAIEEESVQVHGRPLKRLCLERKSKFQWHPGMLLEGAQIQLSFLKDLVTLRNPQSHYSFLNYLKHKGRLDRFANRRKFYPNRVEFNDYYSWVAGQLDHCVLYEREVVEVEPVPNLKEGGIDLVKVVARNVVTDEIETIVTRNLVVATGGVPTMPRGLGLQSNPRVVHSNEFLHRKQSDFSDTTAPYRFVVVGSGQSAAEIFEYLHDHYPNADITAALRRFAYQPADDSHFVNEIFFPSMEDFLYDLPERKRRMVIEAHRDTNYSCVDNDLIENIYEFLYQNEVQGIDRARIRKFHELRRVSGGSDVVSLEFLDLMSDETVTMEADYAIMATGYVRPKRHPLIDSLAEHLVPDGADGYKVNRHYNIETVEGFRPRLFLQGFCEDTHGLSDTLLSTLPIRSYQILEALHTTDEPLGIGALEEAKSLGV